MRLASEKILIGRSEWCQLPELNIPLTKAKVDTGAKTSSIHAVNITAIKKKHREYVCFDVHPLQSNEKIVVHCCEPIIGKKYVMSSNGHKEYRFLIETTLNIGAQSWKIKITLSNRDPLRYRLLLGREALSNRVLIDPSLECNQGKLDRENVLKQYEKLSDKHV